MSPDHDRPGHDRLRHHFLHHQSAVARHKLNRSFLNHLIVLLVSARGWRSAVQRTRTYEYEKDCEGGEQLLLSVPPGMGYISFSSLLAGLHSK